MARAQQAKPQGLCAATNLCRLWQQQGKRDEAYQLLVEVYGWLLEGFDTAALQATMVLLDALTS